ncbi:endonuclease/exonuclease/phosphatase family protein [Pseudalkalibacillus sp. R45]|uniref:endonuclease/exonuclease/phosphatase family protein n=1 Tax=Pseudalkalibacillus sp. R45 TaxID=3457433 RepID=UPI003FCE5BD1
MFKLLVRIAVLGMILFGMVGGTGTTFAEDASNGTEMDVRVMTYNIHAGAGSDGAYDIDRIANVIEESGAEIIGLQEVDVHWGARSNNDNIIEDLAEQLDMHYFFAPIYDFDPVSEDAPRRQFGVAVLSKYPIVQATNQEITRLSTQDAEPEPKLSPGFAEAIINVKGALVPFYVTHLDYRGDPTIRTMQVDDMLNIFEGQAGDKILVGDMNATPEAPELAPLFDMFTDAWAVAGDDSPGFTYSALSPTKRIDYIFTSDNMTVQHSEISSTLASDHLPVIADITLTRGDNGPILKGDDES